MSSARSLVKLNKGLQMKARLMTILLALVGIALFLGAFPHAALAADATYTGLAGHIRSVVSDGTDVLAVNTDNGHIYKYDGVLWTDHGGFSATCLYRDPWNRIYAGTTTGDIYVYAGGTTWTWLGGMPYGGVNCITADTDTIGGYTD